MGARRKSSPRIRKPTGIHVSRSAELDMRKNGKYECNSSRKQPSEQGGVELLVMDAEIAANDG